MELLYYFYVYDTRKTSGGNLSKFGSFVDLSCVRFLIFAIFQFINLKFEEQLNNKFDLLFEIFEEINNITRIAIQSKVF